MSREATEFGRQVRALRLAAGLTQAELAEASGISERTVSDLERGLRRAVYPATARSLAGALRVPEDRLALFQLAARGQYATERGAAMSMDSLPAAYRSRLPFRLTRLIGREAELDLLRGMVLDSDIRLVTLVGPGGVGKTRLAAEVAATTRDEFTSGTYFVDLSPLDDPQMLLDAVATSVGVQPGTDDLLQKLAQRFGLDPCLLVLDTFEHLLAAAPNVAHLVTACPGLTVLATSRSPLNLRGEREVSLQPLAWRDGIGGGEAKPSPAVELFLERATAVGTHVPATPSAMDAVADICARLDGLPLAIELVAARVKLMSVTDLQANLDRRLDALSGGARDLPDRHRTMRSALDWSYALLDGPEMRFFRELSVFRGSFGRDAAEAIALEYDPRSDVLATLGALVNASLVVVRKTSSGEARYRLLDLMREYAVEKAMAAGDYQALRQRHAEYYLALAERAEPELRSRGQREWYERLLEDEGNTRAALAWALETGSNETALRLAGALWMFWRWAGLFTEGRGWLGAALAAGAGCTPLVRYQALWGVGWLSFHQGDYGRTEDAGQMMLQLIGDADGGLHRRNALTLVGNAALAEGQTGDAIAKLTEALAICEHLGPGWHRATSRLNLGTAMLRGGLTAEAKGCFERALAEYEDEGDRHFVARTLIQLGQAALVDGEGKIAAKRIKRALEISIELGDAWSIAEVLEAVVNLRSHDRSEIAATLAGAAERLREQIAMRPHPADAVINRAHLDEARTLIGAKAFDAAWAEGRQSSLESAVGTALVSC